MSSSTPIGTSQLPHNLIRSQLENGKVIPFLGAGASLVGRAPDDKWTSKAPRFPPSAAELAAHLEALVGYSSEEPTELTRVAQYVTGIAGRGGLRDSLRNIFSKDFEPAPLHNYLARFDNPLIVTTNYDSLLESAFQKAGRRFHRVIYKRGGTTVLLWNHGVDEPTEVHPNELDLEMGTDTVIFKMHGSPDREDPGRDSYVITEDDYVEFLARMASRAAIPSVFAEPFQNSHFLFLGYGLQDWNLRVLLYRIWQEWHGDYASWAIQHRARPLEAEFWMRRQLTIYEMTIDDFLNRMTEQP